MTGERGSKTEKYIEEMRKVVKETQTNFEKGMKEADRLGKMIYDDVKDGVKRSGKDLKNAEETVWKDMEKEVPAMVAELKEFQAKMERRLKDLEEDLKKANK